MNNRGRTLSGILLMAVPILTLNYMLFRIGQSKLVLQQSAKFNKMESQEAVSQNKPLIWFKLSQYFFCRFSHNQIHYFNIPETSLFSSSESRN